MLEKSLLIRERICIFLLECADFHLAATESFSMSSAMLSLLSATLSSTLSAESSHSRRAIVASGVSPYHRFQSDTHGGRFKSDARLLHVIEANILGFVS